MQWIHIFSNKKKVTSCIYWLLLLALLIFPGKTIADELVNQYKIPFYAIDENRKPVYDLKKQDIQFYIDGQLIDLSKFNVKIEKERPERLICIIFDAMFSSNYGVKRARQIARELVLKCSEKDTFLILVNSAREGMIHIMGPVTDKSAVIQKINKVKLFPGSSWFKDMFSPSKSAMDRFSASSDHRENEYFAPPQTENRGLYFANHYIKQLKRFDANLNQVQMGLGMIRQPKIVYYFSEGFQAREFGFKYDDKEFTGSTAYQVEGFKVFGVISEYSRKLVSTLKNSGSILYGINSGKLKTMTYDSSGSMDLDFLIGDKNRFFQGVNTQSIINSISGVCSAYYELKFPSDSIGIKNIPIDIRSNYENILLQIPSNIMRNEYKNLKERQKKLFALNVVVGGILPRIVGDVKRVKYKKQSRKDASGNYQYEIRIKIPNTMQGIAADIYVLTRDKNSNNWAILRKTKTLLEEETITTLVKRKKKTEMYFVITSQENKCSIFNTIK